MRIQQSLKQKEACKLQRALTNGYHKQSLPSPMREFFVPEVRYTQHMYTTQNVVPVSNEM